MRARTSRRRVLAVVGSVALAVLGLSACAPDAHVEIGTPAQVEGELSGDTLGQLQSAVADAMTATGSSGAIVGVWVPWSGTWVAGIGTQSPSDTTPVKADMRFRVGDVTRAMVCDALYAAASDGLVALDDSVTEYVSGVPDLEDVTLVQLCDSTAGIGSYQDRLQPQWISTPKRVWNPRELVSYGLGQERSSEPGAAYRDSDAGYLLLGLALERATGKDAATYLDEDVFDPLDLTSTSLPGGTGQWASGAPALQGNYSVKNAEGVLDCGAPLNVTDVSTSTGYTDSGVVSTIADLGRYAQALAAGALAEDEKAAEARWDHPLAPWADAPTWLTATGGAFQAGSLIGQYGSVPGYLTAAFADPQTGLAVAVVLNNSAASAAVPRLLAWELAAIASKAPAASGQSVPESGLPWTAEQFHEEIAQQAVCAPPAQ